MNIAKPTREEWNSLYQAAIDFKRLACWEWMYGDDIFGVVDPETGETAYCCIMGESGEYFAVAGYLGPEGLSGILGEETYYLYMDVCKQLGLPLEMVEHLDYAEEFRNGMFGQW